jgi:hypothetical protein
MRSRSGLTLNLMDLLLNRKVDLPEFRPTSGFEAGGLSMLSACEIQDGFGTRSAFRSWSLRA